MGRFITKNAYKSTSKRPYSFPKEVISQNNIIINEVMNTKEKVELAAAILAQDNISDDKNIKKVKKEKGLIERTESSKIILTEDNRELLND